MIDEFTALKRSLTESNLQLRNFANETESLRQKCLISHIRAKANGTYNKEDCGLYAEKSSQARDTVDSNTELFACVEDLDLQINSFERSREALNQTAVQIDEQIDALQQRLATSDVNTVKNWVLP